jgi:hypothetical protein
MSLRFDRLPAVVDARAYCDSAGEAWAAPGPVPSIFEFARACGRTARLSGGPARAAGVQVVAILYLGGGMFEGPGTDRARFGVLLKSRRRLPAGRYRFEAGVPGLLAIEGVPLHALAADRARALGANHYFLVR